MWIHTVNGFVSIVKHNQIPNCLLVRGRVKADLEAVLGEGYEITVEPGSDYTYRAIVDAEDVAVIIADAILDIDYTSHFKDVTIKRAPKVEHGSRSRALYAIWNAMSDLQGYRPYSKHLRTEETVATRRYQESGLFTEPGGNEWTRGQNGQWHRNPGHVKGGGKAASTARATSGHYDWSQHPQSAAYTGNGNVTMDKALDILSELEDADGIVLDDVAEQAADEEASLDELNDAEQIAKLDELTEYALANFPEAEQWTEEQWETYYLQNVEHQEAVDAVTEPVDTAANGFTGIAAVQTAVRAGADEEAEADWESLQAQEALRRGPKGGRRRQASAVKTAAAPAKPAPRRRTPAAKK